MAKRVTITKKGDPISTTADQVIGKTIYANQNVELLKYPGDAPYKIVPRGSIIGVVWSWIQQDGALYWHFKENYRYFWVKHDAKKLRLDKLSQQDIQQQQQQQQQIQQLQQDQEQIAIQGTLPFYIKKYGIWILGTVALILLGKEIIKKKL